MYYNRSIEEVIKKAAGSFPCIVVYGARQVGKSTTVQMLFEGVKYITLDDTSDRALAKTNPKLFLETYSWPLIIDEIQKVPELLSEIKIIIDKQKLIWMKENKEYEPMYILTGSNQYELQNAVSESLAGRTAVITMASFSSVEIEKKTGESFDPEISVLLKKEKDKNLTAKTTREIFEAIFNGGMPDVVTGRSEREIYFRSYISTYIEKDIRNLINVSDEAAFMNFISIVALRTGQQLNIDDISKSVGIDNKKCKKWISILESSGIIATIQPFMKNASNRIIKTPKIYFMDTGLCAYLCKWPNAEMLEKCAMSGAFFETYVVSEIIKSLMNGGKNYKDYIYYYRDRDAKEIDVIYYKNGSIYPIEIKKGITPTKATKNFIVLEKFKMPVMPGLVIDCCDKIRPINERAYYCPVSLIGM